MSLRVNGDPSLRSGLDLEGLDVSCHAQAVAALRARHPHSVALAEAADGNCVTFTLGRTVRSEYLDIARFRDGRIFAGRQFMEWLLDRRLTESAAPKLGGATARLAWCGLP